MSKALFSQSGTSGSDDQYHIDLYNRRDMIGFEYFFRKYFASVCLTISKRVKDDEDVRTLAHDTFINTWKSSHTFDTTENLKAFLLVAARNKSINYSKRSKKGQTSELPDSLANELKDQELDIEREIRLQRIEELAKKLPPYLQKVYTALILEKKRNIDYARELGKPANSVATSKASLIEWFRDNLAKKNKK